MPETVSPDALTCRLHTAIGETESVTVRVDGTSDGGTEVTRVVHANGETLTATTTLDTPVTLACSQVVVTRLSEATGGIKLVRPVLRRCGPDETVDGAATFHRTANGFRREGRRGPPTAPTSSPSYTWQRLQGEGFVAGTLVPAIGTLVERVALSRQRRGVAGDLTVTAEALTLSLDRLAQPERLYDCRVENGTVCIWALGERESESGTDRTEHAVRFVPPFPVTAAGGTVTTRDGTVVVTVPRCERGEQCDGSLDVTSAENEDRENPRDGALADAD
ncbi:hypothetical protein [Haloarchaeobius sp. DT45]|uniref:hypothetical protein n=1 Tax=Haloarchaeobius sp. DT45 TaxID=3446116 RepID=UPI003F6CDA18